MLSNLSNITVPDASSGALGWVAALAIIVGVLGIFVSTGLSDQGRLERRTGLSLVSAAAALAVTGIVLAIVQWNINCTIEHARVAVFQDAAAEQLGGGFFELEYNKVGMLFSNDPTLATTENPMKMLIGDERVGGISIATVHQDGNTYDFLVTGPDGKPLPRVGDSK